MAGAHRLPIGTVRISGHAMPLPVKSYFNC